MSSISPAQRFTRQRPCPICSGCDGARRGQGTRCYGFISDDGLYAHCTRDEHAGALKKNTGSDAYAHRLHGECRCGMRHCDAQPSALRNASAEIVATYDYCDERGTLLFQVVRYYPKTFKQRRPDGRGGWIWDTKGIRRLLYRLPELIAAPPGETVFVAEGEKDADNLRALGLVATCNPGGAGKWHFIKKEAGQALAGRSVVILVDKDDPGRAHAEQVATLLHGVVKSACVLELPGEGKDASDWIASGGNVEALRGLLSVAAEWKPHPVVTALSGDSERANGGGDGTEIYRLENNRFFWARPSRDPGAVPVVVPLSNFSAEIVEEVRLDDGAEVSRVFVLRGRLHGGTDLTEARVAAAEFSGLSWVTREWGARAVITAGMGMKDRLREAIQIHSQPACRTVYRHSGWRTVNGQWAYLFHDGAVGASGVSVELDAPLDRFVLPARVEDITDAVQISLSLLECGPPEVMFTLLGATYLAPVASLIRPDFALWLFGTTGNLKSELAAFAQGHFGLFDRKSLPASWISTATSLEGRTFTLKDAICVIDDYAPQSDVRAQRELESRAHQVLRGVGNRSGRGRARADLTLRPDRPPRGIVLGTGEDVPPGSSLVARLVVIEVDRSLLDLKRITKLQGQVARLPHAMRGYIEWLGPQMNGLEHSLIAAHQLARAHLQQRGAHLRQPEALAHLYVGVDLLLQFAVEVGAINAEQADGHRASAHKALLGIGERQADHLRETDPGERFVHILRTLLTQGRIRFAERHERLDQPSETTLPPPGGEPIGWQDGAHFYVLPDAARRRVVAFLREAGESWPHSAQALNKALVRRGFVVLGPDRRPQAQKRAGGGVHRVLVMPRGVLEGENPVTASVPGVPGLSPVFSETGDTHGAHPTDEKEADDDGLSPVSPVFSGHRTRSLLRKR